MRLNALLATALMLTISACGSRGGIQEAPVDLPETLPSKADVDIEWWHLLGDDRPRAQLSRLQPVVESDYVYAALDSGALYQLDPSGKKTLLTEQPNGFSAPVSVDENSIAMLTRKGQLVLTDKALNELWSLELGAIALAPALLTQERVFVQTMDGRVNAVERITGRLLWAHQEAEPDLTITGTSAPILVSTPAGDAVVTGLSNGKLLALSVLDGSVLWEYRIARASGKTDISKLADVDATVTQVGNVLVVAGYQGDLVVVDGASGRILQGTDFSSYRNIEVGTESLYAVNDQSHIVSLDATTLSQNWINESFEYRQISNLVVKQGLIYAGDQEGYLHVLDQQTGEWLASRHIDWRGAQSSPVPYLDGVLFQGVSTRLKYVTVSRHDL